MDITYRLLIVEDDESNRRKMVQVLTRAGYDCVSAAQGREALTLFDKDHFHAVLCDLMMPELDGISLLKEIKKRKPQTVFFLITGHGSVETAITAMKIGAYDYLTKPIEIKRLKILLEKALLQQQITLENLDLKDQLAQVQAIPHMLGSSSSMHKVYQTIKQIGPTAVTVLLSGESGTGKEMAANAIQSLSERSESPFIKVNCGALSMGVLESELFGHEKGAFTGAVAARKGRFELAHGGTIFLDEIGEADPQIQVKLLRVLEERQFERVGGEKTISVDVRIIAATNQNLKQMVADKKFREDLYYRLRVVAIDLPPLREHPQDIPILISSFVKKFNEAYNKKVKGFSSAALHALHNYSWPGNVRELRNIIEGLVVLSTCETIERDDLPDEITQHEAKDQPVQVGLSMAEIEKMAIIRTLAFTNGDREKAAAILKIGSRTIYRKINEYGLDKLRTQK